LTQFPRDFWYRSSSSWRSTSLYSFCNFRSKEANASEGLLSRQFWKPHNRCSKCLFLWKIFPKSFLLKLIESSLAASKPLKTLWYITSNPSILNHRSRDNLLEKSRQLRTWKVCHGERWDCGGSEGDKDVLQKPQEIESASHSHWELYQDPANPNPTSTTP